jgi:hypothetical protein
MYVRRLTRLTYNMYFVFFACLCEHLSACGHAQAGADRRLCGSKKDKSTKSTMSLRSRCIGAMRSKQDLSASDSPMDTFLKRPARESRPPARLRPGGTSAPEGRACAPEGTEKKPMVVRSRGVMQRSQHNPLL